MIDWEKLAAKQEERIIAGFDITEILPRVLPLGWRLVVGGEKGDDGAQYINRTLRQSLIVSFAREADGKRWAHLSMAGPDRLPTWTELADMKKVFLGDRKAVMVLPSAAEYVNIHKNCLHVFCCLDGDPLPDFTGGTGSI